MKLLICIITILGMILPVSAMDITAPQVPSGAAGLMPEKTDSFSDGLQELLSNGFRQITPALSDAAGVSIRLIAMILMISVLQTFSGPIKGVSGFAGAAALALLLLDNAHAMIRLAEETILEMDHYGKLLLPVMTSAMAAQGRITSSAALYTGSAFFISLISSLISAVLIPAVYLFLGFSISNAATGENLLKRLGELLKSMLGWSLKTLLMVFTAYMSITGIVSGTTDAAALKATKVTISTVVPVVGGILSDASEAVLVSAGLLKNAAGIYGILAMLALFLGPFLKVGSHYLILKFTAAVCSIFGTKQMTDLLADFSTAQGYLLGMTGAACLMHLISTICFMRGVS